MFYAEDGSAYLRSMQLHRTGSTFSLHAAWRIWAQWTTRSTTMSVIRWSDAPVVGDSGEELRATNPDAKRGPRLDLGPGWEPHWTYADARPATKGPSK